MNSVSALLAIVCAYYSYQWGAGYKKMPNGIIVFFTMAMSVILTIPAYYLGVHHKNKLSKQK